RPRPAWPIGAALTREPDPRAVNSSLTGRTAIAGQVTLRGARAGLLRRRRTGHDRADGIGDRRVHVELR
ncbi:MAG TPA: hypothetical protein VIQ30_16975, partial [Pseudonocardia sp.]